MIDPGTAEKLAGQHLSGTEKLAAKTAGPDLVSIKAKALKIGADPNVAVKAAKSGKTIYDQAISDGNYMGKSMDPAQANQPGSGRFKALTHSFQMAGDAPKVAEAKAAKIKVMKYGS